MTPMGSERNCVADRPLSETLPPSELKREEPSLWQKRCAVVKDVALNVLKLLATVAVYWVNPSLFALGFMAGVVIDGMQTRRMMILIGETIPINSLVHRVKEVVDDLRRIWDTQPWSSSLLLALGAFLALPVTMAGASFGVGAHIGSKMVRDAVKISYNHTPKHIPFWHLCR